MSILEQILENHLRTYIETINPPTFQNIVNAIQDDLEVLTENGLLDLGPDIGLTGKSLEIKIKLLFSSKYSANPFFQKNIKKVRDTFELI